MRFTRIDDLLDQHSLQAERLLAGPYAFLPEDVKLQLRRKLGLPITLEGEWYETPAQALQNVYGARRS